MNNEEFNQMDQNNDGKVTQQEFNKYANYAHPEYAQKTEDDANYWKKQWLGDEYAGNTKGARDKLGQFYTPPELASEMVEKTSVPPEGMSWEDYVKSETILDPAAGSGNLLAAAYNYGFDPKNIYANELDPTVTRERLIPRLSSYGVPRENIYPWPAQVRRYGSMEDAGDVKEAKAQEIFDKYVQEHPDEYKTVTSGKDKGKLVPKDKEKSPTLDYIKENYGAGNILLRPYYNEVEIIRDDLRPILQEMFKAEDAGDTKKADELYLTYLARNSGPEAVEEAIENEEVNSAPTEDLNKEVEQLDNETKADDEVDNDAVEDFVEEATLPSFVSKGAGSFLSNESSLIDDSYHTTPEKYKQNLNKLHDFVSKYGKYMIVEPAEWLNWKLNDEEDKYIRNRMEEEWLPSGVAGVLQMLSSDAMDKFGNPDWKNYEFWHRVEVQETNRNNIIAQALAELGFKKGNDKFLTYDGDPVDDYEEDDDTITNDDVGEYAKKYGYNDLFQLILDAATEQGKFDYQDELDEYIEDWKYEFASKNGFKGTYADWIQSVYDKAKHVDDAPQIEDQIPTNYGWEKADEPEAIEGNNKTGNEAWDQGVEQELQTAEDTPEKQEALKEFQEAPKEVEAIDSALSTPDPEEAKEILEETFPELTDDTVEVNLSRKEKAELAAAQALYDNINKAIDEMATMGKSKKSKAEKEADKAWLEEQELKDQIKMNPGNFLPDLYKQIVKAEPRDVDSYWEKVDHEFNEDEPLNVAYEIKDDPEDWRRFIDWNDHVFKIPFLNWKGKFYEPKTFGYDKPQINAGEIPGTDNSIELGDSGHTVAGGSTSNTSFSGGSSGGSVSSGSVVSSQPKQATPGRSFGHGGGIGHVNLVGSSTNPVAKASASNGGGVTSGKVMRSSDPNMSKGGHLSESRTQLPGGWANNQAPGGNLDISAGADYQDKEAMTDKGSLLSAKLEMILQEDSQTWDGNNSGDKYAPYVFFIGDGEQFYVQKGRERHAIKNIDDNEANELIMILTSNK